MATGFPAGQTPLETRVEEVVKAVADGASEIDIVINRNLALTGQWEGTTADGVGRVFLLSMLTRRHMLISLISVINASRVSTRLNFHEGTVKES